MRVRKAVSALVLLFLVAIAAQAGYKVNVTAPQGFADDLSRIAIVTIECCEGLNCRDVERQVRVELNRMAPGFLVVSGVPDALLSLGSVDYTTDLRAELAEELQVDALLELTLPRGEKGVVGWKGSEATVRLQLVTPTGEILMAGEGTGRARNTLSPPESIARATAERILKLAFRFGGEGIQGVPTSGRPMRSPFRGRREGEISGNAQSTGTRLLIRGQLLCPQPGGLKPPLPRDRRADAAPVDWPKTTGHPAGVRDRYSPVQPERLRR